MTISLTAIGDHITTSWLVCHQMKETRKRFFVFAAVSQTSAAPEESDDALAAYDGSTE